jgi:hypothetical protein
VTLIVVSEPKEEQFYVMCLDTVISAPRQPYEHLIAVLRRQGYEKDARWVAIAKPETRRKRGGLRQWTRCWSWVLKVILGYGYKPERALIWAFLFVFIGFRVFYWGRSEELIQPAKGPTYIGEADNGKELVSSYPSFDPLAYSIDTFLPIIDIQQSEYWRPDTSKKCWLLQKERSCGAFLRIYLWIHIIFGWLLTTLFVIGFTGLVRKD